MTDQPTPRRMMRGDYPMPSGDATVAADMCPRCKGDNSEAFALCETCAAAEAAPDNPATSSDEADNSAWRWAETIAAHGSGDKYTIDIDAEHPGGDQLTIEIRIPNARILHAMLGDAIREGTPGSARDEQGGGGEARVGCKCEQTPCEHTVIESPGSGLTTVTSEGAASSSDPLAALRVWLSTEAAICRRNADAASIEEAAQALGGMAAGCELAVKVIDGMAAGRGLPVSGGVTPTAGFASAWGTVQSLNDWLSKDSALPAEVLTLLQILKITEEAGEVAEAVIGATGSNPNKGSSHTWEDVQRELCDTITTAMTALARITPNPQEIFAENLARIATRALGDPAVEAPQ